MVLEVGSRLGHYDVTALIGEGGMGQVWQATDTKLNRQVALKILPEVFAADPDRLARFQREAQVLASLNHPGIAAIYGIEEAEDTRALVLELVEGPTLADRIAQGPIPVDEALPIAKQIAEALEAAHEAGVIHRDLKPANIKVRDDGTVKVLDFGLAKALDTTPSGDPSESPTLTGSATALGVIMGTAAYMSPEQARGRPVDKRSDIWAFGAVLYELLSGTRPFEGRDVSETLAAVIQSSPRWDALPGDTLPRLTNLLCRCLEKEPRQRIQAVGDIRLAMEGAFETMADAGSDSVAAPPFQVWQRPVPLVLAVLGLTALSSLGAWTLSRPEPTPPAVARFVIVSPGAAPRGAVLAMSPDGAHVIYQSGTGQGGTGRLNIRAIDEFASVPLRGSEGDGDPFLSPDGAWVGFLAGGELRKVSVVGGAPLPLTNLPGLLRGASWGTDDRIIFGTHDGGLFGVSGGGGESETLTLLDNDQGETSHTWPFIIPDRDAALFVISTGQTLSTGQLAVLDLNTGAISRLGLAGVRPHYVSTGHLVYAAEDASVQAVPFDAASLDVMGNPVPLVEGVLVSDNGAAVFAISDNGQLAYMADEGLGSHRSVVWVDRQGHEDPLEGLEPAGYRSLRLSPDGTQLVLDIAHQRSAGGGQRLWTYDVARGVRAQLTSGVSDRNPLWTPDGERIVFARGNRLFWTLADGTGVAEELLGRREGVNGPLPESWLPDGRILLTKMSGPLSVIEVLSMDGVRTTEIVIESDAGSPVVSPDGQWIAYHANESGQNEVYLDRFPQLGDRRQISASGGRVPLWSPDGSELFYRSIDGRQVFKVAISTEPRLTLGASEMLFEEDYLAAVGTTRPWNLSSDGQRFVIIKNDPGDATASPEINVVLNWSEELKARVPVS